MTTFDTIQVLHIKQPFVEALETFVLARILNPVCQRPVPVLTHQLDKCAGLGGQVQYFAMSEVNKFWQRIYHFIDYRFGIQPFYYFILRRLRPNLIHAHFSGAGLSVLSAAEALNIPLIINFYGIETKYHLKDPAWYSVYEKLMRSRATFICSSDIMKQEMVNFGFRPERIRVIRCGIDMEMFDGESTPFEKEQVLKLLCVGRLHLEKGIRYLLEACRYLKDQQFDTWHLTIVGDGPLKNDLLAYSKQLGIEDKVTFTGKMRSEAVKDEMQQAHLFVLPSLHETQGVVFQEAQAMRTPVIGTRVGGIPEGVLDNVSGFLVDPENPVQIAEKILFMAKNPELLVEMGEAGRRYVLSKFGRQQEYEILAELYHEVINRS